MFQVFPTAQAVAQHLANLLYSRIERNPKIVLGLATGSTMEPVYEALTVLLKAKPLNLSELRSFNLDEYLGLAPTHKQSYNYFMHHQLFDRIGLKDNQVTLPQGQCSDSQSECEQYSAAIASAGIDFQLLGIGGNGHVGFNEPGTSFDSLTHVVELTEKTRIDNGRFFDNLAEVPTHAITMGIKDILSAKEIALVITGAHKAETVLNLYNSTVNQMMPASALKQHANVHYLIDAAAASLLPPQSRAL